MPSAMLCDLHLHSYCSDGEHSPAAVVDTVADAGVQILALTDHDTVAGLEEARGRAQERGVHFVSGIEMTTYASSHVVHLLGLGLDVGNPALRQAIDVARANWDENQQRWIESAAADGINIAFERDFPDHPVQLPALVERLCRLGYKSGDAGAVYADFRAFFASLPPRCFATLPSPIEAAAIIREAGGAAFLAHPAHLVHAGLAPRWLDFCDGLEAHYARYEPAHREMLRALAAAHRKLYCCGSDWHGWFTGPYVNPRFEAPLELLARLGIVDK